MDYLKKVWEFLVNFWESLKSFVIDLFYFVVNTLIELIASLLDWVANLLPHHTPYTPQFNSEWPILSTIAWMFPVETAITMFGSIVLIIIVQMTIGLILRWVKAIS